MRNQPHAALGAARAVEHLLTAANDLLQSAQSIAERDGLPEIALEISDRVDAIDEVLLPQVRATIATLVTP